MIVVRSMFMAITLCGALAVSASAQDDPPQHHHEATSGTWTWATDANVFVGFNDQERHFADFSAWESQNWFMGSGGRSIGRGRLTI